MLERKPDWLKGVPVLAKIETREIWEGTFAIEQLHYLVKHYLNNQSPALPQSRQQYQTNLTLPQPISVEPVVLLSPQPQQQPLLQPQQPLLQPQQPLLQPQQPLLQPQQPLLQPQQPLLQPQQPLLQPQQHITTSVSDQPYQPQIPPPVPNQPLTLQNFPTNKTEKKLLNKVQPMPPPDDERNQQPFSLPPLPKKIKNNINTNNNQTNNNQTNNNHQDLTTQNNLNDNHLNNNTTTNTIPTTNTKPFELFSSQEINKIQDVLSKSPNILNHVSDTLQVNIDLDVNHNNNKEVVAA